jgi:hypothetical protein
LIPDEFVGKMREDEMKFERLVPLADEEMMGRSWFVWVRLSIRCRTVSKDGEIMNGKSIRSKI